jgi:hypothetical protein
MTFKELQEKFPNVLGDDKGDPKLEALHWHLPSVQGSSCARPICSGHELRISSALWSDISNRSDIVQ